MTSPVEKITKMFMKTVEMTENSTNDLVRYLAKRLYVFANTVIACNRTMNDNKITEVSVIKEPLFGHISVLSKLECFQMLNYLCSY